MNRACRLAAGALILGVLVIPARAPAQGAALPARAGAGRGAGGPAGQRDCIGRAARLAGARCRGGARGWFAGGGVRAADGAAGGDRRAGPSGPRAISPPVAGRAAGWVRLCGRSLARAAGGGNGYTVRVPARLRAVDGTCWPVGRGRSPRRGRRCRQHRRRTARRTSIRAPILRHLQSAGGPRLGLAAAAISIDVVAAPRWPAGTGGGGSVVDLPSRRRGRGRDGDRAHCRQCARPGAGRCPWPPRRWCTLRWPARCG